MPADQTQPDCLPPARSRCAFCYREQADRVQHSHYCDCDNCTARCWGRGEPSCIRDHTDFEALFAAIEHGDEEHRAWLREALNAWFDDRVMPAPRGNGVT